jgi:hypothetical protein
MKPPNFFAFAATALLLSQLLKTECSSRPNIFGGEDIRCGNQMVTTRPNIHRGLDFSNGISTRPNIQGGQDYSDGRKSRPNINGGLDFSDGISTRPNIFGGYDSNKGVSCRPNIFGGMDCR